MIDTAKLKEKILDLAIRGKLVPQDPNDEPASVLLEKIRAEKLQMVKEGKLKQKDIKDDTVIFVGEDNLHYEKFADGSIKCIEDEIPFEIPKSWAWCNLGTLTDVFGRIGYRGYTKNDFVSKGNGAISLSPSNIIDNSMNYEFCSYVTWEKYNESPEIMVNNEDIILVKTGSSFGKSAIVKNLPEKATINPQFVVLKNTRINKEFLYYYLQSSYCLNRFNQFVAGTAIPTFSQANLNAMYIAIPPIIEQQKIVALLTEYIKQLKILENNKQLLSESITSLKAKILDLAIRGKLVPQNPNDEPADVLLERIRKEKEELIKQGKIKRGKKESIIFKGDDNSYYEKMNTKVKLIDDFEDDLPAQWNMCRFGSIANIFTGNSINEEEKSSKYLNLKDGFNYIGTKDIAFDNTINYNNGVKIPFNTDFRIAPVNTPLLCIEGGSAGRKIAITTEDVCFGNKLCAFQSLGVLPKYLYYYLQSPQFLQLFQTNTTGLIGGVSINTIKQLYFKVPPIQEQSRIVNAIEKTFFNINQIEKSLS